MQLAGLLIALASLGTLGRSFGIVAANRGVKTRGPYRLVRHPAYFGYLVAYVGYVAENPSLANLALLCLSTAFQLVRIGEEERLLPGTFRMSAIARPYDASSFRSSTERQDRLDGPPPRGGPARVGAELALELRPPRRRIVVRVAALVLFVVDAEDEGSPDREGSHSREKGHLVGRRGQAPGSVQSDGERQGPSDKHPAERANVPRALLRRPSRRKSDGREQADARSRVEQQVTHLGVTLPCCDLENEPDASGQPWLRMSSINRRGSWEQRS